MAEVELVRHPGPLVRERCPLCLVQSQLQRREAEQCAFQPDGRERDADLLEQLVARKRRHLRRASARHHLRQHRSGGLRDRTAAAGELHFVDRVAVVGECHVDRDLVAAERILSLRLRIGALDQPVAARVFVVIEDDFPIKLVEFGHQPNTLRTLCSPSTSRSISSRTV